jgi:radical SAM-linked protein
MTVQRVRLYFAKRERVRYISHLDVLRYWERAIRRAELPLSYSQGFTPHPRLQFAGPLPLGYLADREVVDVGLDERLPLPEIQGRLATQTVQDLPLLDLDEVPLSTPPPQNNLLWADYTVEVPGLDPARA